MTKLRILMVEDDPVQIEVMEEALRRGLREASIDLIRTEHEFCSKLEKIAANPPDVAVIDVMLRWTDPSPDLPKPPPEVIKEGHYKAGVRCQALLGSRPDTRKIPVILYTVLEQDDFKEQTIEGQRVERLSKESDSNSLIDAVLKLTRPEYRLE